MAGKKDDYGLTPKQLKFAQARFLAYLWLMRIGKRMTQKT
jgi:hypothetical protein